MTKKTTHERILLAAFNKIYDGDGSPLSGSAKHCLFPLLDYEVKIYLETLLDDEATMAALVCDMDGLPVAQKLGLERSCVATLKRMVGI